MPAFQAIATYLDLQELFIAAWRSVGLYDLTPLTFDDPNEETETPPYAYGMLERVGQFRYAFGEVVRVRCMVMVRIPRGYKMRWLLEQRFHQLTKQGRTLTGLSEFKPSEAKIDRDTERFAGIGVELLPVAWELWYDVENE